jgi:protocatechuate 3,4-dioxygenase beta subunit
MNTLVISACWVLLASCCLRMQETESRPDREPIVGQPCEGCEAVFVGLPESLTATRRIAPENEPGEAMKIRGTVRDQNGHPVSGVIVYAYHTNAKGVYPTDEQLADTAAFRHGRLRSWAKTDAEGNYGFDTIRPASYPNTEIAAHVHMHVIEPGRCTYYIDELLFEDDPHLTQQERDGISRARGGSGLTAPRRDAKGTWIVTRDIVLGKNVPDYPKR